MTRGFDFAVWSAPERGADGVLRRTHRYAARAPWQTAEQAAAAYAVPVLDEAAWAAWAAQRARWLELGADAARAPFEPTPAQRDELAAREAELREAAASEARGRVEAERRRVAKLAELGTSELLRERYAPSRELGTLAARVAAHEREPSLPLFAHAAMPEAGPAPQAPAQPRARNLLWCDTETSGTDARAQVIEVATLRTDEDGGRPRELWSTLVRLEPGASCSPRALEVSGLDPKSPSFLAKAMGLREALLALAPQLEGAVLAGHNVAFDRKMLAQGYAAAGLPLPAALAPTATLVDTLPLARAAKKQGRIAGSTKLSDLRVELGLLARGSAHRAAADVGVTVRLFRWLTARRAA